MTTKSATQNQIETLRAQAQRKQEEAVKQSAAAQVAAQEAERVEAALQAHREKGSRIYFQDVLQTNVEERKALIDEITAARATFQAAVHAGKPYVPAFVAIKRAEHELAVHEQLVDFAVAKTGGSAMPKIRHLPSSTLVDEINAAIAQEVGPLQEIMKSAQSRAAAWIDRWSDDNPVDLEGAA